MGKQKKSTTDAVKILHNRYIKGSKKRLESIERERVKLTIAEQIYELRTKAHLTQKQLAGMIGTTQSVISRLEDADYDGYTLATLEKIASALKQKLQVRFVPEDSRHAYA